MSRFPEDDYPASSELRDAYERRQSLGRRRMADSSVVICGLARQLGDRVHEAIATINAIAALFGGHRVAIYENDSTDGTDEALEGWASCDPLVHVRCEKLGRVHWPSTRAPDRTVDMAAYRNINRADACAALPGADVAIVFDTDVRCVSLDGLADTFGRDDWDATASNGLATVRGRVVQFDAFAWRDVGHPAPLRSTLVNPRVFRRGIKPVRVLSAFGGMGVYRMDPFRRARYAGGDCEHVAFHASFARMFVNPSQLVLYT